MGVAVSCRIGLAGEQQPGALLGADDFYPTPEHPVGWLGDFSGRYSGAHDFPLEWDSATGKNILWKTALPNWGHSSPIVVGKKVFLTCEDDLTVCLDAETGSILWRKAGDGFKYKGSTYHNAAGWSMGTVCSDGKSIFVTHYNGVVVSYDLDGNVRWKKEAPPHGWSGASPVLIDGKFVVLQGGGCKLRPPRGGPRELAAYSCADGALVWRNDKILMTGWHYTGVSPVWVEGRPYLFNWCGQFFDARDGRLVRGERRSPSSSEGSSISEMKAA
jgi:outer membrane protein assembly factor BamB